MRHKNGDGYRKHGSCKHKNTKFKICPDCGENSLMIVVRKKDVDGITYSRKFYYCGICEYEKEFKLKGANSKLEFVEES